MKAFTQEVLVATGYLSKDGTPAEGLMLPDSVSASSGDATRLRPCLSSESGGLGADAVFRVGTSPVILFKSSDTYIPEEEEEWHRVAWNFGVAPLLWVTTPEYIRLYNAYQPPEVYAKESPLLDEFHFGNKLGHAYKEIEEICGRRHLTTASFWKSQLARKINRQSRVDNVLLNELGHLLSTLVKRGLRPSFAQKLVGRCIFFQYLIHRGYLDENELSEHFGADTLHLILSNIDNTYKVFRWIRTTFNGDLFPIEDEASERQQLFHSDRGLEPLSDFFGYFNIADGQGRLFPFRFDAIPVELISSIYEKFAHMSSTDSAPRSGMHYTPINLVDLVLDPVFEEADADACILDPACGSGVFLVESLRRLTWLRSKREPLSRELVNNILTHQIRGVDISPAALSVAAFSLYLALLELAPSSPSGFDALAGLRFEPLQNRVLFATSIFEPELEKRLVPNGVDHDFDIIVGNPPWTYNPAEKVAARELVDAVDISEKKASIDSEIAKSVTQWSGTNYARVMGLDIPPRSSDWAFLWRSLDFAKSTTRIALIMKATPFFSLAPKTQSARDAVLRAFPNISLVNLSQLRTSRLFQEYESWDGDQKKKIRAAGPALLFLSNCLPVKVGCVSVMEFHWSSTFNRTGVFELPADLPRSVELDKLCKYPGLLKAATFGTERDAWFLERLSRKPQVTTFKDWRAHLSLAAGCGYIAGTTMKSNHLVGLPCVSARDVKHGQLASELRTFEDNHVHRSRDGSIFEPPLVLLPEGSLSNVPLIGRYTAVFEKRGVAYNSSFFGVSFSGRKSELGQALAAVMHSRLVAYQLALIGGTVGVKQTKIEAVDLANVLIPHIQDLSQEQLLHLSNAYRTLTIYPQSSVAIEAAFIIDQIVENAIDLSDLDIKLLADADRRARAIFLESLSARSPMLAAPAQAEIKHYADNVCAIFNAFASTDDDQILEPSRYTNLAQDLVIVKLVLTTRKAENPGAVLEPASLDETDHAFLEVLGGSEMPYLKPAKSLRIYIDRSIYLLKPAQYRYFSPAAGQSDADRIVADLMEPSFISRKITET